MNRRVSGALLSAALSCDALLPGGSAVGRQHGHGGLSFSFKWVCNGTGWARIVWQTGLYPLDLVSIRFSENGPHGRAVSRFLWP
jgi:hypothetical protein